MFSLPTQVHWRIQSDSDVAGDFLTLSGSVTLLEGQREAEIVLLLMPDAVPELEELYTILLTAVEGGATLDQDPDVVKAHVRLVCERPSPRVDQSWARNGLKTSPPLSPSGCLPMMSLTVSFP